MQISLQGNDATILRLSDCLSFAELASGVGIYTPLCAPRSLPHITFPPTSAFHAAALCAAAIHGMTLPTRLQRNQPGSTDISDLSQLVVSPNPHTHTERQVNQWLGLLSGSKIATVPGTHVYLSLTHVCSSLAVGDQPGSGFHRVCGCE